MTDKKPTKKTTLFSFHMFDDLLEMARDMADEEWRSVGSIINQAVRDYFEGK